MFKGQKTKQNFCGQVASENGQIVRFQRQKGPL